MFVTSIVRSRAWALRVLAAVLLAGSSAVWATDFDTGYRDGYHNLPYRDREGNKLYADGFKAGEKRRQAGADAGSDYDRGYRDGLNNVPYRDRDGDKAYANGYRAGEAQRKSGVAAAGGSDYDNGFRDGYARQARRSNASRAYADGYKAGEARRPAAGVVAAPGAPAAIINADYEIGFRDALNNEPVRERDRGNRAYVSGYRAGQAKRVAISSPPHGPNYAAGYQDGYNRQALRESDRKSKAYTTGFRAGQSDRSALLAGRALGGKAPVVDPDLPPPIVYDR